MLEVTKVRIRPNLTFIGKDMEAAATFNADVDAAQPDLPGGTIMTYTAGGVMTKAAALPVAPALMVGILAADSYATVDSAGSDIVRPAMIYRSGTFVRSAINYINGTPPAGLDLPVPPPPLLPPILPGDPADIGLNDRGIFLEEGFDENLYP
jgi:hypothetical protein